MQVQLSSPEITCEHCIATIRGVVEATGGASFVAGDPEARTFVVEVASGATLDALGAALAEAGYPLGALEAASGDGAQDDHGEHPGRHPNLTDDWRPAAFRIEKTEVGANVNYDCYCGCDAGFALDRSQADPAPESCCCGNRILVGPDASRRLTVRLEDPAAFRIDTQTATMPWGQPLEVAIAIPA